MDEGPGERGKKENQSHVNDESYDEFVCTVLTSYVFIDVGILSTFSILFVLGFVSPFCLIFLLRYICVHSCQFFTSVSPDAFFMLNGITTRTPVTGLDFDQQQKHKLV